MTEVRASDCLYDLIERAGVKGRPLSWLIWSQRWNGKWWSGHEARRIIEHTLGYGLIGPVRRHSPIHVSVGTAVCGLERVGVGGVAVAVGQAVANRRQCVLLICAGMKRGRRAGVARLLLRRVGLMRRCGGALLHATDALLEFVVARGVAGGIGLFESCTTTAS